MACGCRPRLLPLAAVALMLACLGAQPAGATTKRPPHGKAAAKKKPAPKPVEVFIP